VRLHTEADGRIEDLSPVRTVGGGEDVGWIQRPRRVGGSGLPPAQRAAGRSGVDVTQTAGAAVGGGPVDAHPRGGRRVLATTRHLAAGAARRAGRARHALDLKTDTGTGRGSDAGLAGDPIPIAIETSRGLLVAVLRRGKRQVFAINPLAASRYRDRHGVSRKKSDPGDALVLANILRTDMHAHRPLPNDSDLARAVAVLARAQQDATWNRQQMANQLRSLLRGTTPSPSTRSP
jgi:hypothetical protein